MSKFLLACMAAMAVMPSIAKAEPTKDVPQGDYKIYSRTGMSLTYDPWENYLGEMSQDSNGFLAEIVFGENNKVWMRNILAYINADYWTEGYIEGNKIKIPTGQVIAVDPETKSDVKLWAADLHITGEGEEKVIEAVPTDVPFISYTISGNTVSLDDYTTKDKFIGGFIDWEGTTTWNGLGDYGTVYTITDMQLPAVPADLSTKECNWTYINPNKAKIDLDDMAGFQVQAGIDGDKLYVTGFLGNLPLIGKIKDGKVEFADNQLMGMANAYPIRMRGVNATITPTEWGQTVDYTATNEAVTFDFDATTLSLSNPSADMALTTRETVQFPMAGYIKPSMSEPFTGAITPKQPAFTDVRDLAANGELPEGEPNWVMALRSSDFGVDDTMMDRSKLYFRFWVNSNPEPYVFDKERYTSLTEDIVDVPLTLNDQDFFISMGNFQNYYLFVDRMEGIRACLVYKDGDTESVSESAIWGEVSLKDAFAEKDDAPTTLYDLAGRIVNGNPAPGIYITNGKKILVK